MKKQYLPPTITVVTFKVENGYASSGFLKMFFMPDETDFYNASGQENWSHDDGGTFGDGW